MVEGLLLFLGATVGAVWMWVRRRAVARREAGKFLERAELPFEEELVAATQARFERRQVAFAVGAWVGSIPGTAVFIRLEASPTALAWWAVFAIAGVGVAICVLYVGAVRAGRADGPRAASLRQRRLLDFLSPVEVVLQYGFLLMPAVAGVLGVQILAGDGLPAFMEPIAYGMYLVGTVVFVWMVGVGATSRTLSRSQQVIQ